MVRAKATEVRLLLLNRIVSTVPQLLSGKYKLVAVVRMSVNVFWQQPQSYYDQDSAW